MDQIYSGT